MVCQRGISTVHHRTMSVMIRIDGRGGKMYSFWAMYSFRMSFWIVPPNCRREKPCSSPTAT